MGGFTLIGPHYTFENKPNAVKCRCLGYTGTISGEVENALLLDKDKLLDLEKLPDELLLLMEGYHLGEEMHYVIRKRINTENRVDVFKAKDEKQDITHATDVVNHNPFGGTRLEFQSDVNVSKESSTDFDIKEDESSSRTAKKLRKNILPWYRG